MTKIAKYFSAPVLCVMLAGLSCTTISRNMTVKPDLRKADEVKIAVLPFTDAPGHPGSGLSVAEALTNQLMTIEQFRMVERTQLDKVMGELGLGDAGLTDSAYTTIGNMAKVDYLVVGSVSEYTYQRAFKIVPQTRLTFNLRIIRLTDNTLSGSGRYDMESGKNAWIGCCLFGYYYIPVAMFSTKNINKDVARAARQISWLIKRELRERR